MYKGYIYRHWIINDKGAEKNYIGQVYNRTPKERWNDGKGYTTGKQDHKFARAIKKYGWDNFNHKVLFSIECETLEELVFWLDEWEKYYIEKYDSFKHGYNGTLGGRGSLGRTYTHTEETKKRLSEIRKGSKLSEEHKRKIGEAMTGIVFSEKRNFKISESLKGVKHSDERKRKNSEAHKGQTVTDETKKKLSVAFKGEKNPNARKVICLENEMIFGSVREAEQWCGKGRITSCCRGKQKTAGGYHWMYYDDYLEQQNKDNSDSNSNVA